MRRLMVDGFTWPELVALELMKHSEQREAPSERTASQPDVPIRESLSGIERSHPNQERTMLTPVRIEQVKAEFRAMVAVWQARKDAEAAKETGQK